MGTYDTLDWVCPNCGAYNQEQFKDGPCMVRTYSLEKQNVPPSILVRIMEDGLYCDICSNDIIGVTPQLMLVVKNE